MLTYLQVKHDGAKATMGKSANISAWTKALGVTVFFTAMHLQLEEEVSLNVLDKAENYLNRDFLIFYIEVGSVHQVLLGIPKYDGCLEEKQLWDCPELRGKLGYS